MKILYLSHHWTNNSHHSQYSGFQRLVVHAAREHQVTLVTWGKERSRYTDEFGVDVITIKGTKKDPFFLRRMSISLEGRRIAKDYDAIHALYDDCTFFLKKNSFTVTFHVLPGIAVYPELKQRGFLFVKYHLLQKRAMRRAKDIVCVSTNLLDGITGKHKKKARFIPHGIDTGFWDPALSVLPADAERNDVLCVGSHGLDRELMKKIILANPSARFVMVGLKQKFEDCPNVLYLRGISDEELRSRYFGADLMIRPLTFATANNSVLEAMAMGKTILASRIPGITDYLDDSNCIFIDTMKDLLLEHVKPRKIDPVLIRDFAIREYSWEKVLSDYINLYSQNK